MGGSASKASSAIKQAARRAPAGAPAAVVPSQAPPPPATAPDVTPDAIAFPDELLQRERARPGKLRDPSRDEVAGRTGAALAGQRAASASNRHPVGQDTWRPPGAPPIEDSPATGAAAGGAASTEYAPAPNSAAGDRYGGGSSGEDDDDDFEVGGESFLNQLTRSVQERGRSGDPTQGPVEVPQIRAKPQKPDPRKRCSPEDLRGVFMRAQHAVLAGRDFDADSEAARMGMDAKLLHDALRHASLPVVREDELGTRFAEAARPPKDS